MAFPHRRRESEAVRITTAPQNPDDDIDVRIKRYLFSMGLRTVCFIGAVFAYPHWWCWVLIVGAVILPYIAVVLANSSAPRVDEADLVDPTHDYKELR